MTSTRVTRVAVRRVTLCALALVATVAFVGSAAAVAATERAASEPVVSSGQVITTTLAYDGATEEALLERANELARHEALMRLEAERMVREFIREQEMARAPAVEYEPAAGSHERCAICLDEFGSESAAKLHCQHVFHVECLNQWSDMRPSKKVSTGRARVDPLLMIISHHHTSSNKSHRLHLKSRHSKLFCSPAFSTLLGRVPAVVSHSGWMRPSLAGIECGER